MRDLEQQIAEWRQQMIASGIKSPDVLDELESHLRDEIEAQRCAGVNSEVVFQNATRRLGNPAVLETEFGKIGETREASARVKQAFFALAGIPNEYTETMNTSHANIEPRWATYLKAAAFALPAICLWVMSSVFVVPKLQQICRDAGSIPLPGFLAAMLWLTEHGVLIGAIIIAGLVLLEWRWQNWARYRRATIGVGTFFVNAAVLFSIFMLVVLAILAAPALAHH